MILAAVYISVFLCALILFDALIRFLLNQKERKGFVNKRMQLLAKGVDTETVYRNILKERGLEENSFVLASDGLRKLIRQSGIHFKSSRVLYLIIAVFLASFVFSYFLNSNIFFSILSSFAFSLLFVLVYTYIVRNRRVKKFTEQLPETLDFMVRSIAAGHPIHTSISLVAREMSDPIGTEFGILNDELTYGHEIEQGTKNMVDRVGVEDLNFLAITLSVQKTSGGNLTEILNNLSDMLRRRLLLKHKIRAISAEGRMTSWFMLAYPFLLYAMIIVLAPNYFEPLWASGYGEFAVGIGIVLMIIGIVILRKIVNFDY